MFLGLPDPHPDQLVTSTDTDPSLFEAFKFHLLNIKNMRKEILVRIRNRIRYSEVRILGSGSVSGCEQKCHGTGTLLNMMNFFLWYLPNRY
jgi:hypothetical protein